MLWRLASSSLLCVSPFFITVDAFKRIPRDLFFHRNKYRTHDCRESSFENKCVFPLMSSDTPKTSSGTTAGPSSLPLKATNTWLEEATINFVYQRPIGTLLMEDVNEAKGLMSAWARRGEPLQVEFLLKRIIDDQNYGSNVSLSTQHYSIAIDAWAKSKHKGSAKRAQEIHDTIVLMHKETQNADLAPTVVSYSTLINAWIRHNPKDGMTQAESIFEEMKESWLSGKNNLVKPDATTVSQLLNGYAKSVALSTNSDYSKDQVERAQDLFDCMEEWNISKTVFCYGALQNVYAQSQLPEAPFQSMRLLEALTNETTAAIENTSQLREFDQAAENAEYYNLKINLEPDRGSRSNEDDSAKGSNSPPAGGAEKNIAPLPDCNIGDHEENADGKSNVHMIDKDKMYLRPTIVNFNSVFNACAKSATLESCRLARDLLEMMPVKYGIEPVQLSYMLALQACVLCSSPSKHELDHRHECAQLAMEILKLLEQASERQVEQRSSANQNPMLKDMNNFQHSDALARVTLDAYNKVLTVLARMATLESIGQMEDLVLRMEQRAFAFNSSRSRVAMPNKRTYNSILNAMIHLKLPHMEHDESKMILTEMAEKGRGFIKHMWNVSTFFNATENEYGEEDDWPYWCKPDSYSYTSVLRLYQKSILHGMGGIKAAENVDSLVCEMESLHDQGRLENAPDVAHYTIAIASWAQAISSLSNHSRRKKKKMDESHSTGEINARVHRCAQILSHMMERHKAGYYNCVPNARTYNAYLDALSRGHYFEEAERVLYHMLHQYNFVYKRNNNEMAPDTFSFNTVMIAMTRFMPSRSAIEQNQQNNRAEAILDRLLEYCKNENPEVSPNQRSFSILINHYTSRSGGRMSQPLLGRYNPDERPYRAEAVLDRMIDWGRDIEGEDSLTNQYFLRVMDSFAYHHVPDGGERAERLLQCMKELQMRNNSRVVIDTDTVRHVMAAWAHSSHPQAAPRAEQYLDVLEEKTAKANVKCYEIVLQAWTRSSLSDIKASRALAVLQRLLDKHQNPENYDNTTSNSSMTFCKSLVINACSFVSASSATQQADAFRIAVDVLKGMIDDGDAASLSYGWFLQLCFRFKYIQLSERIKQVEVTFRDCRKRGLVNGFVWDKFVAVATPELLRSVLKESGHSEIGDITSYRDLPHSWRCHKSSRSWR